MKRIVLFFLLAGALLAANKVRVKDIADVAGVEEVRLIGYGIVIGLDGTGDQGRSEFTTRAISNMLERFEVKIDPEKIRSRNAAAVMVTAEVTNFGKQGSRFDVTLSSLGDATSLQGGTLLPTPMNSLSGQVVGTAQGAVSIGGFNYKAKNAQFMKNHSLVGRIPEGLKLEADLGGDFSKQSMVLFNLHSPDFTTCKNLADAVNKHTRLNVANAMDEVTIKIDVSQPWFDGMTRAEAIADLENIQITVDQKARVVVNERTGTIVVGANVTIGAAAIAHGNLTLEVQKTPMVSQPESFSDGNTVVENSTKVTYSNDEVRFVSRDDIVTLKDIAEALNAMQVTPRDVISIFQALKEAGALNAELIIL